MPARWIHQQRNYRYAGQRSGDLSSARAVDHTLSDLSSLWIAARWSLPLLKAVRSNKAITDRWCDQLNRANTGHRNSKPCRPAIGKVTNRIHRIFRRGGSGFFRSHPGACLHRRRPVSPGSIVLLAPALVGWIPGTSPGMPTGSLCLSQNTRRLLWKSSFAQQCGGVPGLVGGAEEDRTPDLCSAIAALSHLSYGPEIGAI